MSEEIKNLTDAEIDYAQLIGQQSPKNILIRNHFYFNEEITEDSTKNLILSLNELALSIASQALETGLEPCPIELHINSVGGDLQCALQIVQVMKDIQNGKACQIGNTLVPIAINTTVEGEADSGASVIAAIGNHRRCSKYALSLIHPMRSIDANFNTVEERDIALENMKKWDEIYKGIYVEHSKLTREQLDTMFKTETFYTPQQLMEFGLIEEII